jgi:hypothetical protein
MKFIFISFKNVLSTSQKAHCVSNTKIIWLMLCREVIDVHSQTHTKYKNVLRGPSANFFAF